MAARHPKPDEFNGDFGHLYEMLVATFKRRQLPPGLGPEEVATDVLFNTYDKLGGDGLECSNDCYRYCVSAAANVIRQHFRKKQQKHHRKTVALEAAYETASSNGDDNHVIADFRMDLCQLSEEEQAIIILRWEEYTYEEVAKEIGAKSPSTACAKFKAARSAAIYRGVIESETEFDSSEAKADGSQDHAIH